MNRLGSNVKCPTCNKGSRYYLVLMGEERPPRAGDVSVCADCGEFLVYNTDTSIQRMTLNEELKLHEGVWALMAGQRLDILRRLQC